MLYFFIFGTSLFKKMKKFVVFTFILSSFIINAQDISIEEIWKGYFYPQSIYGINSLQDGEHYTSLSPNGVEKFSYKTFDKVGTIKEGSFNDYQFNDDESWLLLETETEPIYRRSKRAKYTLFEMASGKEYFVFDGKKIQEPTLSPDGTKVAFVFDNNLYFQEIATGNVTQITTDGKKNEVINGITDWVYEEEFAFVRAFDWSADSKNIAFIRFDESKVPVMDIDIYGTELYPSELRFKYPKAGEPNALVSVHVYNLKQNKTNEINLSEYSDFYVPRIQFTKDKNQLALIVSNRHQNKLDFFNVDANSLQKNKLFSETDKAWIDTDNITLEYLDDNSFLWASERDGFRHIYHYSSTGKLIKQVTKGTWEITEFYGYNPKNKKIYYQSTETGSINRGVYSVGLNGENKKALAETKGTNNANFSKNFNYFILNYSSATTPTKFTLNDGNTGKKLSDLTDTSQLETLLNGKNLGEKKFEEIQVNGVKLNAYTIKPHDFNPNKKYPLFMFVYGGPGSQQVLNRYDAGNGMWFQYLTQQGYIVACVDNRGTGGKGADFKKVTYKNLGHYEIEDQIAAAKYFGNLSYIDSERIGIFGWSYGGYMSSLAMTKGADVFKAGIAVAPVTNWRFYDTIYTERFLTTPQENAEGYDENSPINFVDQMKGNFLLVHGTADDNVHVQNSMRMAEALIQADKEFDYMVYPDKNHGIYGGNTRIHLFKKMSRFIIENL